MFDLEEINLMPTNIPDRPQTKGQDAHARAKAIECGAKWKCSRVKAWVDLDDCVARYAKARDDKSGDYQPCLECSSIVLHLRNMGKGLPGPMSMQPPPASAPKFEPKPLPQPKKETIMSRPAKKGTPDPIQQEAKTEPKLEIVVTQQRETKPVVSQSKADLSDKNPFAGDGWTKYDPMASRRAVALEFAAISRTSISFSAGVTERLKLKEFPTMTLYHGADGKRIGVELRKDSSGVLKCTVESKGRAGVKVAAQGLIKALEMDPTQFKGKRFAVREIAPGFVEIDLKSEVAA